MKITPLRRLEAKEIRYLIKQYKKTHKFITVKSDSSEANIFNMQDYKIKVYNHWILIKSNFAPKLVYIYPLRSIKYLEFLP